MINTIFRVFVEKKTNYAVDGEKLLKDLRDNLCIKNIKNLRVVNRYDIEGITLEEYLEARNTILSEPTVDFVYDEVLPLSGTEKVFAVEYLKGQYDQRADSASQCIQMLTQKEAPIVNTAKVIVIEGSITDEELNKIKNYCINSVDSKEAELSKPSSLNFEVCEVKNVDIVNGFIEDSEEDLLKFMNVQGFAMSFEDLKFCREYFKNIEKRDPSITELKVIDTYWSDHCRHTTFNTSIENVDIEDGTFASPIKKAYEEYLKTREYVYVEKQKDMSLMDIAVIGMKDLRKKGMLQDLDVSDEINACSIVVDAKVNDKNEKWLVMFKNETHNHPTEIEPFGGAATCLGGAIRDPLSGRSYVYQAMRVTGSGDPRVKIEDTLSGKLPQRKISLEAAHGYSSYGNQIGLATGMVSEIYDEDFRAKRMEVGAVIGAVPYENVVRETPKASDIIILLGGRTGRDGCGGATGSSKEHDEESILNCGAEVQKGNPITERKIQRLFRRKEVTTLIKRCNDFGAGGVSVAIGELADGLVINLDNVPKKYKGLDGTELAISESQERMAVVVSKENVSKFIKYSEEENLEATIVAEVTDNRRLTMSFKGANIVDLSRDFLDTNGVKGVTDVKVSAPMEESYFEKVTCGINKGVRELWIEKLADLNVCSKKGLVERFDSSIGAGSVLMPFGGKYQKTPVESMVAKLPILSGDTSTGTMMSYGYNPNLSKWSPFHGALYAVVESVTKLVASGGDYRSTRLTFQEYFEKLGKDSVKWGKPFSALLGALHAQKEFGIAAIGGKDSMSGSFKDMNVPPTLVSFAVDVVDVNKVISPEFKNANSEVIMISTNINEDGTPDFDIMKKNFELVNKLINKGVVISAHTIGLGGILEAVSKMCFGNKIGFEFNENMDLRELCSVKYGSMLLELKEDFNITDFINDKNINADFTADNSEGIESFREIREILKSANYRILGHTQEDASILVNNEEITVDEALKIWEQPLEEVFKTSLKLEEGYIYGQSYYISSVKTPLIKVAKPKVFIPVFPGTNCEYDSKRAFERAGAEVETLVIKNLTPSHIEETIEVLAKLIDKSQIVMLPGGFSAGDEPDGSGKFIATAFRNPKVKESIEKLLSQRDGLMLGICNGFQALIKLGLVPYGKITDINEDSPTLTYNKIGRHVSCMVNTKIVSNLSPWFNNVNVGDVHTIPVSHGEGRFVASDEVVRELFKNGQIATQYIDFDRYPSYDIRFNPNGSVHAIEGITSIDGRILGKMGHSERVGTNVAKNIIGEKDQQLFEAGVRYFK